MALNIQIAANGSKLNAVVSDGDKRYTQTLRHILTRLGTTAQVGITVQERRVLLAHLTAGARTFFIRPVDGLDNCPTLLVADTPVSGVQVTVGEDGLLTLGREIDNGHAAPAPADAGSNGTATVAGASGPREAKAAEPEPPHAPTRIRVVVNDKRIALVKCHPHGADAFKDRLSELLQSTRKADAPPIPLSSTGCSIEGRPTKPDGHEFVVRAVNGTPLALGEEAIEALRVEFEGECGRVKEITAITAEEYERIACVHAA